MGYDNLDFANIQDVMLGANEKKYKQNPYYFGYIEKAIIFYNDDTSAVVEFTDANDAKDFCKTMKNNNIELDKKVYKTNTKTWKVAYKAAKEETKEDSKAKNALVTAGLIAGVGIIAATSGAVGYKLHKDSNKNNAIESTTDLDLNDENGFGVYNYDLSSFADMNQYADEIPDSMQKENAFNYLSILQNFNKNVNLVDGTEQLGGLTIDQLIAIDAYSNSNLYSVEDYVKTFGLYDFSNLTDNFQQGAITTGAYLATGQVDGTALANVFKDEKVKTFYLKSLDYHNSILNAENSEAKNKAIKEFEEYMNNVTVDQTSADYIDYSSHPGAAFATTVIVNSLNYNNVRLSSALFSDTIIIGDGEHQSKLDTVCDQANEKLDDVKELVSKMETVIVDNQNAKIYNNNEIEKANLENRTPVLMSLQNEELDTLITETLCDQEQINDLIDKELTMTNQLVTVEDQEKINSNAIEIARDLQNKGLTIGANGKHSSEEMAEIASNLQNKGDTYTSTKKGVTITSDKEKEALYRSNPNAVEKAKEEYNKKNGTTANESEKDKKETEDKMNKDQDNTFKEGVNFVNLVVSYYETHGNVSGIPAELQTAYNNLGEASFNTAKNTGIMKWEVKNNNQTGGKITPVTPSKPSEPTTPEEEVIKPDDPAPETPTTPVTPSEPTTPSEPAKPTTPTTGGDVTILPGFEDVEITPETTTQVGEENQAITEADIDEYLNTAEGQQFLESITTSVAEDENVQGMTR